MNNKMDNELDRLEMSQDERDMEALMDWDDFDSCMDNCGQED